MKPETTETAERRKLMKNAENAARRALRGQYQEAVNDFMEILEAIDKRGNTFAKLQLDNVRINPIGIHGIESCPLGYTRTIGIDEIVLGFSGVDD